MGSIASDDVKADMPSVELPRKHEETHSANSEYLESAVLGMADGLTVPFALTAGLSSYASSCASRALLTAHSIGSSKLVIIGGLAEIFSGMLSMGLGEYLSTNTKAKQWQIEYDRETREVEEKPQDEEEEIYDIFEEYRIPRASVYPILQELKKDPKNWVDVRSLIMIDPADGAVHDGL
jgi:VIT1/CCC1 family predicted Fe2+/Mn2+ transporter